MDRRELLLRMAARDGGISNGGIGNLGPEYKELAGRLVSAGLLRVDRYVPDAWLRRYGEDFQRRAQTNYYITDKGKDELYK